MRDWALRVGLGYQVSIGVAILMTLAFVTFGVQAVRVSREGAQHTLEERVLRLTEATSIAADGWLRHEMAELSGAALASGLAGPDASRQTYELALQDAHATLRGYSTLSLYDRGGGLLGRHPATGVSRADEAQLAALIEQTLSSMEMVVGPFFPMTSSAPGEVVVLVPVPRAGEPALVLAGRMRLFDRAERLLPTVDEGFPIAVAFIDRSGRVLAGDKHPQLLPVHLRELAGSAVSVQTELVVDAAGAAGHHFLTFAPLETMPAGVLLEFPQEMVAGASDDLTRTLLVVGVVALAIASLGAWIHARWVTQPLRTLEVATRRLAAGDLDDSLVVNRGDEIGRLTTSFEEMRKRLLRADRERSRWEAELERRVVERTHEVRRLLGKVIVAQEEERGRLARELHDETAQTLATTMVAAEAIRRSLRPEQADQRELIDSVLEQGKTTLADVRRIVMDLRPSMLEDLSFPDALSSWAEQRLAVSGTELGVSVEGDVVSLGQAAEIGLFRILQEAVNNVVRHAQASHARIRLAFLPDRFVAEVVDNGKGFAERMTGAGSTLSGVGFQSMRERAELLGAELSILSEPGRGTKVRLQLPIDLTGEEANRDGRNPAAAGG